jgi:hypothetical protein
MPSLEGLAIFFHEHWFERQSKGSTSEALMDWEVLPERFRESCRAQAASITVALGRLSPARELVPQRDLLPGEPPHAFTDQELTWLAEQEHMRWLNEQISRARSDAPAGTEVELQDPKLVPWDKLPEAQRTENINAVRAWDAALAEGGLRIAAKRVISESVPQC